METAKKFNVVKLLKIVIPALIAVAIAMIQPVGELTVESMRFAGIFICLIIWMVCDVWPDFVITLVGLCAFVVVGVCSFKEAFAPFASSSVWLVIGAFGLSAGVAKSGLLKRLSYMILKLFPENFRGQIMALFATGLVISPLIPSLNAKAAILGPFSAQISESLGYEKSSKGARGLFGAMVISTTVLGMAFYSGAVPVFTLIGFMDEVQQAQFHWMSWFAGTWLWLIIMVALCFVAIIVLYKPTGNNAVIEKGLAKKQLEALGPMTQKEKISAVLLALGLLGWMTTKYTGLDATIVALTVLLLLFITGVLAPADFKNSIAWSSVVFIGCIYSLAALISKMGFSTWLAQVLAPVLAPVVSNIWVLIPVICIVVYIMRIVVVSQTAAITIIFAIFGSICMEYGIHPWPILFTGYVSTLVWHYAANNVTYATALASTNDKMVTFKDTFQMNIVYMAVNLVGCMASIPVWMLLGYC